MQAKQLPQQEMDDKKLSQAGYHQSQLHDHEEDHHDPALIVYSDKQMRTINQQGYLCLAGGLCLHLVLGTFYLWGGISPYIASYLKQYDESVTLTQMSLVFPFLGLITNSVLSFGVKLAERVGYKPLILAGGCLISLAFLICSFITNFWTFVAVYCIFVGVPSGLVYMLPIICGWKYFPQYRGRVSGLIIAGYGFGSFIFNFVCLAVVNPNSIVPTILIEEDGHIKKYFGPEVYNNVPSMLRILSLSYFILTIISTILIRYPRDLNLEQQLHEKPKDLGDKNLEKAIGHDISPSECQTLKQGLKSRPFAFLFPMIILSTMFGLLMANSYKIYGLQLGIPDSQLTIIGSIASVSNGSSRLMWASLMDKFGFKLIFNIVMIINLVCTASIGYVGNNFWAYLVILSLTMCCEGGMFSCFPAESSKIFGHKIGPVMYGILFFGIGLANLSAYLLMKFTEPTITFLGLFWLCFGLKFICLVMGILFRDYHNWEQ